MALAKIYLILYNVVQIYGWSVVLYKTTVGLIEGNGPNDIYNIVQPELNIFQTLTILEVVHSMIGIVHSPVFTTLLQVMGRLVILWPVNYFAPTSRDSVGVILYILAWSITEVIRYSFYAFGLLQIAPFILVFLRYTLFIVLYPIGAIGELLTLFSSLSEIREKGILTSSLPNKANMSFDLATFLVIFSIAYIPLFPQLYFYMFAQRKKVLNAEKMETRKKAN